MSLMRTLNKFISIRHSLSLNIPLILTLMFTHSMINHTLSQVGRRSGPRLFRPWWYIIGGLRSVSASDSQRVRQYTRRPRVTMTHRHRDRGTRHRTTPQRSGSLNPIVKIGINIIMLLASFSYISLAYIGESIKNVSSGSGSTSVLGRDDPRLIFTGIPHRIERTGRTNMIRVRAKSYWSSRRPWLNSDRKMRDLIVGKEIPTNLISLFL